MLQPINLEKEFLKILFQSQLAQKKLKYTNDLLDLYDKWAENFPTRKGCKSNR